MEQANPYQAPQPVLPTATEAPASSPVIQESAEDMILGLKLLRVAAVFFCIILAIDGFWNFCNAYCYLIDDPLPHSSDFYTYWLNFSLSILSEAIYIAGLYYCSTRKLYGVSRAPLLISLILAAMVFPDQIFRYALDKPWIYFEGHGNAYAIYAIFYLANVSCLAIDCWLILCVTAHHDTQNQRRVLLMIFLDTACFLLRILDHTVYMLLIADQTTDHANYAIFFFVNAFVSLLYFISSIVLFKVLSSLIAQQIAGRQDLA